MSEIFYLTVKQSFIMKCSVQKEEKPLTLQDTFCEGETSRYTEIDGRGIKEAGISNSWQLTLIISINDTWWELELFLI